MAQRKTSKKTTSRRRPRRRPAKPYPLPNWMWMMFGLAVGLSVAAAIYVSDRQERTPGPGQSSPTASPQATEPDKPSLDTDRFTFYEMLPSFEVVIPEEDLDANPSTSSEPVVSPGAYVLQAGSFSGFADADRMKAQLALIGISSRIQKVAIDDKVYHRVRIGPVTELNDLNRMRGQLREARIDVLVIRVGG